MGVPLNQPKLDHFSIETHGFGDPPFQETAIYYTLVPVLKSVADGVGLVYFMVGQV
jgi:hypothetical protein